MELYNISVSIGITEIDTNTAIETAIKRSDEAMYSAKRNGGSSLYCLWEE